MCPVKGTIGGSDGRRGGIAAMWPRRRIAGMLPWETPTLADYEALLSESEFAAWVLVNGYNLSHTTISVHRSGLRCAPPPPSRAITLHFYMQVCDTLV